MVSHGQVGHLLLNDASGVLKVKVVANFIKKMDKERDKWVKAVYQVNRRDPG